MSEQLHCLRTSTGARSPMLQDFQSPMTATVTGSPPSLDLSSTVQEPAQSQVLHCLRIFTVSAPPLM